MKERPLTQNQNNNKDVSKKNKHVYEFVTIKNSEVVERKTLKKANWFQRQVCKLIRIEPSSVYQYVVRIKYIGRRRLKKGDVVANQQGIWFGVLSEQNRYALLVSDKNLTEKPYLYEKLYIIPQPKEKKS